MDQSDPKWLKNQMLIAITRLNHLSNSKIDLLINPEREGWVCKVTWKAAEVLLSSVGRRMRILKCTRTSKYLPILLLEKIQGKTNRVIKCLNSAFQNSQVSPFNQLVHSKVLFSARIQIMYLRMAYLIPNKLHQMSRIPIRKDFSLKIRLKLKRFRCSDKQVVEMRNRSTKKSLI
jgi:hypothetical protein